VFLGLSLIRSYPIPNATGFAGCALFSSSLRTWILSDRGLKLYWGFEERTCFHASGRSRRSVVRWQRRRNLLRRRSHTRAFTPARYRSSAAARSAAVVSAAGSGSQDLTTGKEIEVEISRSARRCGMKHAQPVPRGGDRSSICAGRSKIPH
jgi:hypothetical protein